MIRCQRCPATFDSVTSACAACGWAPVSVDGFVAWAPELAAGGTGLSAHSFSLIAEHEERHFWFQSRNAVITWALKRFFPQMRTFLEVGCGTGTVLRAVHRAFPQANLIGSEMASAGLALAARQMPDATFVQMDGLRIPYESEFDVVGAFDVLEHIAADEAVLAQMRQAIVPGGGLVVSVPQHQWLWSAVDDYSRHERRYSRDEMVTKLRTAGFKVEYVTSFMAMILPAMLASRATKRDQATLDPGAELAISPAINAVLGALCRVERGMLQAGLSLPVGGSLLAVAKRLD